MKRLLIIAVLASACYVALPAQVSHATWVGNNCDGSYATDYYVKRSDAQAYSWVADNEGYEWGGGCWNDNGKDDTPGAPDSSGEGPDCSGFTFKSWELVNKYGTSGFTYYDKLYNVHGPYTSYDFHAPASSAPFSKLANKDRSTTLYMDAFAKAGHVAMLYWNFGSNDNNDYMIEALSDSSGTDENLETYRFDSSYVGVRRDDWTQDCWPNCAHTSPSVVVVP